LNERSGVIELQSRGLLSGIDTNGRPEEGRSGNDGEQGRGYQFGKMVMELRHFRYSIA
jgi:hypothetical protein